MARPRISRPERRQREWSEASLDDLVPEDARVRQIWAAVEQLDLSGFDEKVKAFEGCAGRSAIDSRLLLAVWVFATSEGMGSARRLEQLCERDVMYRWLCGGVSVNHHTLSDFRTNGRDFDELLTQLVGSLLHAGVITLTGVAQDGMKVRASAGASSFKKKETLEEALTTAAREVAALRKQLNVNAVKGQEKQAAAKLRNAEGRQAKIVEALANIAQIQTERDAARDNGKKLKPPRASTTDPEVRVMKRGDGGFRPSVNVQFATDVDSGVIVGVSVSNDQTDTRQLEETINDMLVRTEGQMPQKYLFDGGYTSKENITAVTNAGCEVYGPVKKAKNETIDKFAPRPGDTPEVIAWRERMRTDEAREIYKDRASTAERVNADMKAKHGMTQFLLRGFPKISSSVLLSVLAFNILRSISLA